MSPDMIRAPMEEYKILRVGTWYCLAWLLANARQVVTDEPTEVETCLKDTMSQTQK